MSSSIPNVRSEIMQFDLSTIFGIEHILQAAANSGSKTAERLLAEAGGDVEFEPIDILSSGLTKVVAFKKQEENGLLFGMIIVSLEAATIEMIYNDGGGVVDVVGSL